MGSRYGGLKQLDPVGPSGETLMDYSIYDAKRAGFTRVVFLIRREMRDLFEEQVGRKYQGILEVDYAIHNSDTSALYKRRQVISAVSKESHRGHGECWVRVPH